MLGYLLNSIRAITLCLLCAGQLAAQTPPTAATTTPPSAEPAPKDAVSHRPGVGLLAAAGLHTGLALGARFGLGDLGIEITGGYQLLLALWRDPLDDDLEGAAGSSAQFGGEVYYTPWHPLESSAIGLKAGYRYNTILEHGFAFAITFLGTLSEHLAIEGLAGFQIFPDSGGRLRRHLDVPSNADMSYSSSYQFFEYGFELIWYPW